MRCGMLGTSPNLPSGPKTRHMGMKKQSAYTIDRMIVHTCTHPHAELPSTAAASHAHTADAWSFPQRKTQRHRTKQDKRNNRRKHPAGEGGYQEESHLGEEGQGAEEEHEPRAERGEAAAHHRRPHVRQRMPRLRPAPPRHNAARQLRARPRTVCRNQA
eukprot:1884813-Rhodomonas_salina.1